MPDRPIDESLAPPPGGPGTVWDPELEEILHNLLENVESDHTELIAGLRRLETTYGDVVYSELLFLLSHLRFSPADARRHWDRILEQRTAMRERLQAPVDVRVALIRYFLDVNRKLESPKIIELRLFEQTQASAYRDDLTGLYNYRVFREHLNQEILRCERYGEPVSLVMVDIDDFKVFNDRHGHESGNDALVEIALQLTDSLRKSDLAARYGGEEFVLVLPCTTKIDARFVAERARVAVEAGRQVTVSAGVATFPGDAIAPSDLVRCADRALYVAKARGKNLVHLYGEDRRSYRRVDVELSGECISPSEGPIPLATINLSERGFLVRVDRKLPVGGVVDVCLRPPGAGAEVTAAGRVIRVEETGAGRFRAAIRVVEIGTRDRLRLMDWVRGVNEHSRKEA